MRRIVIAAAMSICVVSLPAIASADTLIMRDGTRVSAENLLTFRLSAPAILLAER
jgi:hypothetical protein